MVSFRYTRIHQ